MSSVRLRDFRDKTRATYWFVPMLMSLLGAGLAMILNWISQLLTTFLQNSWYLVIPISAPDARGTLTVIAQTTIGVIGVVFSITLVPLTIASSQYGSIIMRSFMRDRATQFVLGAFGATTFYSMFLIATLPSGSALPLNGSFPVEVAFYMLLANLIILFYFIHHVADSLQAATVIEQISKELENVVEEYPLTKATDTLDSRHGEANTLRDTLLREGKAITSNGEGYVRAIDYDRLMRMAVRCKSVLYLSRQPGDFVSRGDQLLRAWPGPLEERAVSIANRAYILGRNRTLYQDPEYGIYIIVTIAARALSHAINDPATPVMCLNRLGAVLGMLAERTYPSPYFCDKDNQLRVMADPVSFDRLVDLAFNLIREYGRGNTEVLMKMLETIKEVAVHAHSNEQRKALLKHVTLIEHDSRIGLASEHDQKRVQVTYAETVKEIGLTDPQ